MLLFLQKKKVRRFAHLQATNSWRRNRNLVIEVTSHERTGTEFVMESIQASHIKWLAASYLEWCIDWCPHIHWWMLTRKVRNCQNRKMVNWCFHYVKVTQRNPDDLLVSEVLTITWTLKRMTLLAVFWKWPTYRGKPYDRWTSSQRTKFYYFQLSKH